MSITFLYLLALWLLWQPTRPKHQQHVIGTYEIVFAQGKYLAQTLAIIAVFNPIYDNDLVNALDSLIWAIFLNGIFYIVRDGERLKQKAREGRQETADFHTVVRLRPYHIPSFILSIYLFFNHIDWVYNQKNFSLFISYWHKIVEPVGTEKPYVHSMDDAYREFWKHVDTTLLYEPLVPYSKTILFTVGLVSYLIWFYYAILFAAPSGVFHEWFIKWRHKYDTELRYAFCVVFSVLWVSAYARNLYTYTPPKGLETTLTGDTYSFHVAEQVCTFQESQGLNSTVFFLATSVSVILGVCLVLLPVVLSPSFWRANKTSAYECGFEPFFGQKREDLHYISLAIAYIIFDVELLLLGPLLINPYTDGVVGLILVQVTIAVVAAGTILELMFGGVFGPVWAWLVPKRGF